ncbi:unannotated protein [freshwater metagenome]|uniref:Unannotated protein n=1 Tax=freshwater metagenome TaxID=449393 RepID=A0A6J7QA67_9ZZZZ
MVEGTTVVTTCWTVVVGAVVVVTCATVVVVWVCFGVQVMHTDFG